MSNQEPGPDDRIPRRGVSVGRRLALVLLILLLTGTTGYTLTERLYAQALYEWAGDDLKDRKPAKAVERLEKAVGFGPSDPVLWIRLGDAYHQLATMRPVEDGLKHLRKAQTAFATAFSLNPLDAEAAYRVALEAAREEKISAALHEKPSDSPYNARRYFEEALRLRRGSVQYHHAYARYLNTIEDTVVLVQVVENTVRLRPRMVTWFKKEPFWTGEVRSAAIRGLEKAVLEGAYTDEAKRMMATVVVTQDADQKPEKQ